MCGIAGLYALAGTNGGAAGLMPVMQRMTGAMPHRGPDDDGHWQDPDHPNIVLGQRRLAILDLSPLGHQPMPSPSGRYWCVYNGEIYNYQDLESELRALGHSFKGRSDTEVFLTALDQWGLNQTCQKIIGMYAFIIWDRKEKTLHLIRDRIGKKPLYLGWAGGNLVLGSELKVLMAHPAFVRTVNADALRLYMTYGYVPSPYSIFKGVWTLPPGTRMAIPVASLEAGEDLSRRIEYYWDVARVVEQSRAHPAQRPEEDLIEEFDGLLNYVTGQRMIADVPLGAFLSGGIDSSAIVALMQGQSSAKIKTYSIGFEDPRYNEAPFAADIARHLGTDHHEMIVTGADALSVVPQLPDIYDEPFADASQIPTYLVSKFARQSVTVALSGDGGDEMLGGYNRHYMMPSMWSKIRMVPRPMRKMVSGLIGALPAAQRDSLFSPLGYSGQKLDRFAEILSARNEADVYRSLVNTGINAADVVLDGQDVVTPVNDPSRSVAGLKFAEKMMLSDTLSYLPDDILVKVDRASMAVSLEARAPLLDTRVLEYVWTLPLSVKVRDGKGKWLLRQVLSKYVPASLYDRPKRGFTPPIDQWLAKDLRGWAEDLLSYERLTKEGHINSDAVQNLWAAHKDGSRPAGNQLWTILMFQAWQDRWLRG